LQRPSVVWKNPQAIKRTLKTPPRRPSPRKSAPSPSLLSALANPGQLKATLAHMRTSIKEMSATLHQVEQLIDTAYNLLDAVEVIGRQVGRTSGKGSLLDLMTRINLSEVLAFLQSPLVQTLLEDDQRKQEG